MSNTKLILAGYAGDSVLPQITAEDAAKLTHLNVAFGHVKDDRITIDHVVNLSALHVLKEYNAKLQILLSVGGWSAGGFSEAASTPEGRRLFAESALEVLEAAPFDGIDLDWEYPCYAEAGITASPADKQNFTLLLKELRQALDAKGKVDGRHYLLTIAAGADQYYIDGTEMDAIHPYLDFIQLMTYDMRGGFQTLTGHHTNLYSSTGDLFRISVDASVQLFVSAGVPRHKIVIGAAFYSRMWNNVPDTNHGYLQMAGSSGGYGPDYTKLVSEYINMNGYTRYWDDEAKAPYLYNGSSFITYDDPESLAHKCEYIKANGIAGIMFWEYSCDHTHTLLEAMHKAYGAS
ncbi:glycoside hydrolase family 18 protein [Paenibacillus taiwanensis]|uniref:glycoside hydrolase family 18 protein n=1 Tax=Paenibacillus taiwanensis TaxID=401638 RepID=UPI0003F809AF|nr:glycoside hydrolase family 18 protein [Paenibacillus taiwanensis]